MCEGNYDNLDVQALSDEISTLKEQLKQAQLERALLESQLEELHVQYLEMQNRCARVELRNDTVEQELMDVWLEKESAQGALMELRQRTDFLTAVYDLWDGSDMAEFSVQPVMAVVCTRVNYAYLKDLASGEVYVCSILAHDGGCEL